MKTDLPPSSQEVVKSSRDQGIRLLERREYSAAIQVLENDLPEDSTGELHALAGLAHFQLQAYEQAARSYQAALALRPDDAAWNEMFKRASANAIAEIQVAVPEVYYFNREKLLEPASPGTSPLIWMPYGPHSTDNDSTMFFTPALAAAECAKPGPPVHA